MPRFALASTMQSFCAEDLYSCTTQPDNTASALEVLELLCRAIYNATQAVDVDLGNALCSAVVFFAVSCDTGCPPFEQSLRQETQDTDKHAKLNSKNAQVCEALTSRPAYHTKDFIGDAFGTSRTTRVPQLSMFEYRYSTAVLRHSFSAISQMTGTGRTNLVRPYIRLAWLTLKRFLTQEGSEKDQAATHTLRENTLSQLLCSAILKPAQLVAGVARSLPTFYQDGDCFLVSAGVDILKSFLLFGTKELKSFSWNFINNYFEMICSLREVEIREKFLELVTLTLKHRFYVDDQNVYVSENLVESKMDHGRDAASKQFHGSDIKPETVYKTIFTEACKSCAITRSPNVRCKLTELLALLVGSEKGKHLLSSLIQSGFTDYLFEALRCPPREQSHLNENGIEDEDTNLVLATLMTMKLILESVPAMIETKWSFGIPIVLKVAEHCREQSIIRTVFHIFRVAFAAKITTGLTNEEARKLLTLTVTCGSKLSICISSQDQRVTELMLDFEAGIMAMEQITLVFIFSADTFGQLLDCVECAMIVMPTSIFCYRLLRNVIEKLLDSPDLLQISSIVDRARGICNVVCGRAAVSAFGSASDDLPPNLLCEILFTVSTGLDPRLYKNNPNDMEAALQLYWNNISPCAIFKRLEGSDTGHGLPTKTINRSELWSSMELEEENEQQSSDCRHPGDNVCENKPCLIRQYLGRLCMYSSSVNPNVSLHWRDIEKHIPSNSTAFKGQLHADLNSIEFRSAFMLLQQSALSANEWSFGKVETISLLGEQTNSLSLSNGKNMWALSLVRTITLCMRGDDALADCVHISRAACEHLFSMHMLDFSNSIDQDFLIYILKRGHDIDLRLQAWTTYARWSRGEDAEQRKFDLRLSTVIISNAGVAKCLVSALYNGCQDVARLTLELCSVASPGVAQALNTAGLASAITSVLESKCIERERDPSFSDTQVDPENWECPLSDFLDVITMTMPYANIESYHRLLMVLVDSFPDFNKMGQVQNCFEKTKLHGPSQEKYKPSRLKSSGKSELSILRCFIIAFNGTVTEQVYNFNSTPRIFQYLTESKTLGEIGCIIRRYYVDDSRSQAEGSKEMEDFVAGAVSTFFDYALRLQSNISHARKTTTCCKILKLLPSKEKEWMKLFLSDSQLSEAVLHPAICRRGAVLQLLGTAVKISAILPENNKCDVQIGQYMNAHVIHAAASASALLSSAALDLLQIINDRQKKILPCFVPFNLECNQSLTRFIAWKLSLCPQECHESEIRYLRSSLTFNSAKDVDEKYFISLMHKLLEKSAEGSSRRSFALAEIQKRERSAGYRTRNRSSKSASKMSEASNQSSAPTKVENAEYCTWDCQELMLGRQAILAAPLVLHEKL